jgi:hypothetical protein
MSGGFFRRAAESAPVAIAARSAAARRPGALAIACFADFRARRSATVVAKRPTQTIRPALPFSPGGTADLTAHLVARAQSISCERRAALVGAAPDRPVARDRFAEAGGLAGALPSEGRAASIRSGAAAG